MFDWFRLRLQKRYFNTWTQNLRIYNEMMVKLPDETQIRVEELSQALAEASNIVRYHLKGQYRVPNFEIPELMRFLCIITVQLLDKKEAEK